MIQGIVGLEQFERVYYKYRVILGESQNALNIQLWAFRIKK